MSRMLSQADEKNFIWLPTRKIELNLLLLRELLLHISTDLKKRVLSDKRDSAKKGKCGIKKSA